MSFNVTCPLNSLGYGTVGLNIVLAIERAGCEPAVWAIGNIEAPEQHHTALRKMLYERTAFYDASAPSLRIYHQFDLAQHIGRGPRCAMPIFELDRFKPNELHHLKSQDIVFANSLWAANVLAHNGVDPERIHPAPLGVDHDIFRPQGGPIDGPTVFLNVGKWEVRKGHDVLIEAFCKAFEPTDNVRLLMHCFNPCFRTQEEVKRYNDQWLSLYKNSKMGDHILVSGGRVPTQQDVANLMATVDCGVFPSRAEGWGLESAEMLAMGKHVIMTDAAAHTEYADDTVAFIVETDKLEDAHDGIWFKANDPAWGGKPGRWAAMGAPQVDRLVAHMRSIHELKQEGSLAPNAAGVERMRRYSWDNCVKEVLSVL